MVDKSHSKSGFALLVSLIVVGAVLSVGLVILDLTIKQVRLAVTTKDSEVSFHAANAGMECARYWRRNQGHVIAAGGVMTGVTCFGQLAADQSVSPNGTLGSLNGDAVTLASGSGGAAYQYKFDITWGPGNNRCTRVNTVVAVAPAAEPDVQIPVSEMQSRVEGYPDPGTSNVTCPSGSQCSTVAVQGYNQACAGGGNFGYGVVERKVLLEF